MFDLTEGKITRSLTGHRSNVTTLHYHPHGDFIASGGVDMHVKIWDVRKKSCVQTYKGHGAEVTCVRFSPDGRWLTTAAKDGLLSLWDLKVGKMLHSLPVGRGAAPSADAPPPTGPSSVRGEDAAAAAASSTAAAAAGLRYCSARHDCPAGVLPLLLRYYCCYSY